MANWWSLSNSNNWDLHAVVRGCSSSATIDPYSSSYPPILSKEECRVYGDEVISFPELAAIHELEELCKPFFTKPDNPTPEKSSPSPTQETRQQQQKQPRRPTSKKRRNQQKKVVCQVPANGVSADMWAWRKYGQKPIKGSPFPRGYYRCSSSKGCMARKQVERSQADPSMLVITYTAEHDHPIPTHRNSLAGSTRNKFGGMSMMLTRAQVLSPRTPLMASMEEELMGEEDGMGRQSADLEESHKSSSDVAAIDSDDDEDFVKSFFSSR